MAEAISFIDTVSRLKEKGKVIEPLTKFQCNEDLARNFMLAVAQSSGVESDVRITPKSVIVERKAAEVS
jgi:hypothetical protein